jgi:hypothetical protein
VNKRDWWWAPRQDFSIVPEESGRRVQQVIEILAFLFGLLTAFLGWLLYDFLGEPIKRFMMLREQIRAVMHEVGLFGPTHVATMEDRKKFRSLEAELKSFSETRRLPCQLLWLLGYRVQQGASCLADLGGNLSRTGTEKMQNRLDLERALRFPQSYNRETIERFGLK